MTPEERSNIENRILNYNKKGWTGSKGAILLQKAWELIEYYKESNKMAYEQSNALEDRVIKAESEIAELENRIIVNEYIADKCDDLISDIKDLNQTISEKDALIQLLQDH